VFKRASVQEPVSTAYDQARLKAALAAGTTTAAVMSAKDRLAPRIDSAKEQWGPAFESAKESGAQALHSAKDAVVPLVDVAVARGADLLSSDTAHEARNRAALMMAAAKGRPVVVKKRRWPLAAAFFAIGSAVGAAVAMLTSRTAATMSAQTEESGVGGRLDLAKPAAESTPPPLTALSDQDYATDEGSADKPTTEADGSFTSPRATF
jgi:hypothetical protein